MALSENLDVFFDHFAVDCVAGSRIGRGILDAPTEILGDGMVLSNDYSLTCKTADFGDLKFGDSITVDGTAYSVREARQIDDARMSVLSLQRV